MSFAAPLGVGLTGSGEYLDIEVLSTESSGRMVERLNAQMAEGMEVLSFKRLPDSAGNAMSLVAACDYTVSLKKDYEEVLGMSAQEFFDGLCGFIETGDLNIVKKTKKGEKQMDLRPYIYEHRPSEDGDSIFLRLSAGSAANVKPELLLEAFCRSCSREFPVFGFSINREEVYADAGSEDSHEFVTLESFGEDIE